MVRCAELHGRRYGTAMASNWSTEAATKLQTELKLLYLKYD